MSVEKDKHKTSEQEGMPDPDDILRVMLNTPPPKKKPNGKQKKPAK